MMRDFKKPRYQEEKAIAVAARLLSLSGGSCDKYWLNKLMYFVERQSLILTGQPIFYDSLFSIPWGPIVSAVKDGIDSAWTQTGSGWAKYFSIEGRTVSLNGQPDDSSLSDFEEVLVKKAFMKFRGWDFRRLNRYFHNLPEYKKTESREGISYAEILSGAGYSSEDIQETLQEISYLGSLENSLH